MDEKDPTVALKKPKKKQKKTGIFNLLEIIKA
jgi:hypothetical protein